jgi:adenylate kinase
MAAGSELGRAARQYVESGDLVPDDVVAAMVRQTLAQDAVKARGVVLDGYPRTVAQADLLDEAMATESLRLDQVVLFEVGRELLLSRLTARRICRECRAVFNVLYNPPALEGVCDACGGELYQRSDDTEATALDRLAVYGKQTEPLIGYYEQRGLLLRVDGSLTKDANYQGLCRALGL